MGFRAEIINQPRRMCERRARARSHFTSNAHANWPGQTHTHTRYYFAVYCMQLLIMKLACGVPPIHMIHVRFDNNRSSFTQFFFSSAELSPSPIDITRAMLRKFGVLQRFYEFLNCSNLAIHIFLLPTGIFWPPQATDPN